MTQNIKDIYLIYIIAKIILTAQGNSESAHRYHPISVFGGSTACTHWSISSCFKHTLAVIHLFKQILQYFKIIKTKYYNYYCSSQQHFTKHLPKRASFYSKILKVVKLQLLSLQQTKKTETLRAEI